MKMYWILRKNSTKLLRMYDQIEQMYHHHHLNYHHESKLNLSTLYFLANSFSFLSIHIYFYISTRNNLINNVVSGVKNLPLFYANVLITNLFAQHNIHDLIVCLFSDEIIIFQSLYRKIQKTKVFTYLSRKTWKVFTIFMSLKNLPSSVTLSL